MLGSKRIKWNFTKFLVDQRGDVVQRSRAIDQAEAIASDIEALLWRDLMFAGLSEAYVRPALFHY